MRIISLLLFCWTMNAFGQSYSRSLIQTPSNANETSVAIMPTNVSEMYAACNVNRFFNYRLSEQSWSESMATSKFGVYGDPVLHFSSGHLFFAHLSKTEGKAYGDWFDRIVVQKIINAELWQEQSYSVGYNQGKMQDKPWLSSDEHSSHFKGNVYVSWTEFDVYGSENPKDRSRIRFSYYNPKSDSFSTAITISDITGNCKDSDSTLEGAVTAVGLNGEIYAVWAGNNYIYFDKSTDGGKTWGTDKVIGEQIGGWDMDMPNIMRANGMPFIVTDTNEQIIYVCWADTRNGKADIWCKYSTNQGEGWSDVFQMDENSNSHSYFPNMVYNPLEGGISLIYFDQSCSPNERYYDVKLSKFNPITGFTRPVTINSLPIALPGERFFYGDYIDLDQQGEVSLFSYPVYRGVHSDLAIDFVVGDPQILQNKQGATMANAYLKQIIDVTANHDSLCLSSISNSYRQVKGKLIVWQEGQKHKIKFKYKPSEISVLERELVHLELDPKQDLYLSLKYRYRRRIDNKKVKIHLTHDYP